MRSVCSKGETLIRGWQSNLGGFKRRELGHHRAEVAVEMSIEVGKAQKALKLPP